MLLDVSIHVDVPEHVAAQMRRTGFTVVKSGSKLCVQVGSQFVPGSNTEVTFLEPQPERNHDPKDR